MQSELTKQRNLEGTTAEDTQAVNDGIASTSTNAAPIDPAVQSQIDRQANFEEAANKIGGKLASDPGNITKEEADTMHRREQRAFGQTEKGGLASQTQHQVAENEKSWLYKSTRFKIVQLYIVIEKALLGRKLPFKSWESWQH